MLTLVQAVVCGILALPASVATVPALVQSGSDDFYRAYYLETEEGDHAAAAELYERVVRDRRAPEELRAEAERRLAACREELSLTDFATLVPSSTIFYAELSRPGAQLESLLSQLGLLGVSGDLATEGGRVLRISPDLVRELLGIRGAAIAITGFNPMKEEPMGVAILHPGRVDVIRGLLETALPAAAELVEPVSGFPTYSIEGEAFVTLTHKLVVASPMRSEIEKVLTRMRGEEHDCLARSPQLEKEMQSRGGDLLYFCVNPKPVLPLIQHALADAAKHDPQASMIADLCDPASLRSLVGRAGVHEDGVTFEVALNLEEDHRNIAFNFFRMPPIDRATIERVPEGVAAFVAASLNPRREMAPLPHPEVVTAMDLGREIFGNIVSFAFFALPSEGAPSACPIGDVAAVVTVNDPAKSQAIWGLLLGIGSLAGGGKLEGEPVRIGGLDARTYRFPESPPFYAAVAGDELVFASSERALAAAARSGSGRSVLQDEAFARNFAALGKSPTLVAFVHAGRCAEIAQQLMPKEELREVQPFIGLLEHTVYSCVFEHSANTLRINKSITGIPDVSGLVSAMLEQQHGGTVHAAQTQQPRRVRREPEETRSDDVFVDDDADLDSLRRAFADLVESERIDAARGVGERIVQGLWDDAHELKNFAWAVLNDDPFAGHFAKLARRASRRSNELTEFGDWRYLDTLALAEFETGAVKQAIRHQEQALALVREAGDEAGARNVERRLERFRAGRP